ncbi:MAG: VWA domain-containing protein [Casimicrobiaceae bacterium]
MLIDFFLRLKRAGLPVSTKEFLYLLDGLKQHVAGNDIDDFYYLARTSLIKDEKHFDKFDRVFGEYLKGLDGTIAANIELPLEWLLKKGELDLTDEDKALIEAMGGLEKLLETLRQRLEEQKERHQGGNKWIGTAGTSPFGAYGFNPEGIRIGQNDGRQGSAVKVWDQRAYRNYDDQVELGTRNIKIALRRLRKFARAGAPDELDLDGTIEATARNAGYLDLKMRPERHNTVKVLLFLDAGGSMYSHVRVVEELFSATKTEFKHLEYFYFHNCVYESVWKNNVRRQNDRTPTWEVLRTYPHDYKLIFVGDASMGPYEITEPGGSIEHNNPEAGAVWLQRLTETYPHAVWLNPEPEPTWQYRHSIKLIQQLMENRMYPLTLNGLERGMKELAK